MKPPGWYINGPNKSLKSEYIGPAMLAVLDGCLLGDGSYVSRSVHTSSFSISQCAAHAAWVEHLHALFGANGITSSISPGVHKRGDKRFPYVKMWTYSLVDLLPQRKRWYPHGSKEIPKDLDLSNPVTLAQWHMGDGNTSIAHGRLEVKLHTNGFTEDDVHMLVGKLRTDSDLHSFVIHWRGQPIMVMQHRHAEKFINLVAPHVVECFRYKIPQSPWRPPTCIKCRSIIEGPHGEQRYAKYCDKCASPRMTRYRTMTKEARDELNKRKRESRLRRAANQDKI